MNFVTTSVIAPAVASFCAMPCASDGTKPFDLIATCSSAVSYTHLTLPTT